MCDRTRTWSRVAFVTLLAGLVLLVAIAAASMLRPTSDARADYDVPFDPSGPVAQPFKVGDIEGWLTRLPDGRFKAYSAADPGRRCRIEFIATDDPLYASRGSSEEYPRGFFFDRCFHSTFTLEGVRTFGPAPRGLDEFAVQEVRSGRVLLDLSEMRLGLCGDGLTPGSYCSLPDQPRHRRPSIVDPELTAKFPWPLH